MSAPLKLPFLHKNSFLRTFMSVWNMKAPGNKVILNFVIFSGYNSLVPSNWPRWPFPRMLVSSEKVWWSAGSDERYADQLFRESNLMKFTNKHYFNQEHFRQSRLSSTTLPPNALQDAKDVVFISKKQNKTEARSSEIIKPARWERKGFYWQTELPQWEGGRLFDGSTKFFYGNCCNSGTESRKIVPKVGN